MIRRAPIALAALAGSIVLIAASTPVEADLPIVVPPEDTDSHAKVSGRIVRATLALTRLEDLTGADDDAMLGFVQFGLGPIGGKVPVRGVSLGTLDRWSLRARVAYVVPDQVDHLVVGPLTVAAQRFHPFGIIGKIPVLHLQAGTSTTLATPWLRHLDYEPGEALRSAHGADAELAERGWSVQPLSAHLRLDLVACRSWYVEVGGGPELFRSTAELDRPLAYGARWHVGFGAAVGCGHRRRHWQNDITLVGELRGRHVFVRGEEPSAYADTLGIALQWNPGPFAIAAVVTLDDTASRPEAPTYGVRIQYALGGRKR